MLDIKLIRENPEFVANGFVRRGIDEDQAHILIEKILNLDENRRAHLGELHVKQERRNAASKEIGHAMRAGDMVRAEKLKLEVNDIKLFLQKAEECERQFDADLRNLLIGIPNLPMNDVPLGYDEKDNFEIHRVHFESKEKNFVLKEHFELGESLRMMDFEQSAVLSGSRFVLLRGDLARLERALGQFMLDLHIAEHEYEEVAPPLLVRDNILEGTGQLPKFEEDIFFVHHAGRRLGLIPTSEVPLTNLVRDSILLHEVLPLRFVSLTPCFRSEAGSAGKDTRGMIRQHQFNKVELVSIIDQENSSQELERMLGCAEAVLKKLCLSFRTVLLCNADLGFSACKTYDIEVWLPAQKAWREISSCSLCGDFQARRMDARYRSKQDRQTKFLHTLNGSGVAVGRALIAVMENYQNEDGSITIPEVLRPYMGNLKKIRSK